MIRSRNASTQPGFDPDVVDALWQRAAPAIARRRGPFLLGLSGLQGSGKSTLARQIVERAMRDGVAALTMSLDDFYYGRGERRRLAREVHPLFATRGVPGTHDVDLIHATLDALARATPRRPARVPRFDKGRDTRLPPSRWRQVAAAPGLIVLEGWCVGVGTQSAAALREPCNDLERAEDGDGRWRRAVNVALRGYQALWRRCDALWLLRAPGWDVVRGWRGEQERGLAQRDTAVRRMNAAALARFIAHYERLSRHALATLPGRADLCLDLDPQRGLQASGSTTTAVP